MSHYYMLRCKDCKEDSQGVNNGDKAFHALAKTLPQLLALHATGQWAVEDLLPDYGNRARLFVRAGFLVNHGRHRLVLVSEYDGEQEL